MSPVCSPEHTHTQKKGKRKGAALCLSVCGAQKSEYSRRRSIGAACAVWCGI